MAQIGVWEQAEPGVTRKVFQPGTGLMMMEVHFEEGAEGALHSHPHEQMSYCLKGAIDFISTVRRPWCGREIPSSFPAGGAWGKSSGTFRSLDTFTPLRLDLLGL